MQSSKALCSALQLILSFLAHGEGRSEQTASVYVPPMIVTKVSHNFRIPASEDNPSSGVQADGNGNMGPALVGYKPRNICHLEMIVLGLGLDSYDPVLEILAE